MRTRAALPLIMLLGGLIGGIVISLGAQPDAGRQDNTTGQNYSSFSTEDEANNMEVFRQASPSVVYITSSRQVRSIFSMNPQEIPQGSGSGIVWDERGHIITNFHVIQNASRLTVTMQDGSNHDAEVVGVAPDKDLAVLRIDSGDTGLQPIALGDSSLLEVGRKVIAIGNPFGLDATMTVGVVSALGREINSVTRRRIRDVIQTDAAINPGNSGGPLLNSLGQLVGVNTAIYSPSGASAGVSFAIPVNTVKDIVPDLIEYGEVQRPAMGINLLPPQYARYYREQTGIDGVIVFDVVDGMPPDRQGMRGLTETRSGIRLGDVIVEVAGERVENEDDLYTVLEQHEPGDVVEIITRRDGERRSYQIELQEPR